MCLPKPSLVGVAVFGFNAYRHSESKNMECDRDRHIPTSFTRRWSHNRPPFFVILYPGAFALGVIIAGLAVFVNLCQPLDKSPAAGIIKVEHHSERL